MSRERAETQFFYTTTPLPCPYLPGRTERKVVTEIPRTDPDRRHDLLSRVGFRRSHSIAYAPACPGCSACVPIRIDAARFAPDRGLRRVARANATCTANELPAHATGEQFALFQRYQMARHCNGDMAAMSFHDYRAMVEDSPVETRIVEFRDPDARLVGACLVDWLDDGCSAVYSFFDPEIGHRSLGSAAILWLIDRCRELGLPYVYLGYWVRESPKMAYKARFQPCEILVDGAWRAFGAAPVERVPQGAGG